MLFIWLRFILSPNRNELKLGAICVPKKISKKILSRGINVYIKLIITPLILAFGKHSLNHFKY